MSRPKVSSQCISKGINFSLAYILQSNRDMIGLLLNTHLLYTVQDPFSTVRQSCFQNNFHTLLFIFWWTKSYHHRLRLRKRLYRWCRLHCGSVLSHTISCTWFKIRSAQQDSPVSKTALKSSSLFFGGPSFSITDQDWGRGFYQWGRFHCRSAISHPYFVNSSRSFQRSKKVHVSTSSLSFLFAFWWIVYCFMLQPQVQTTNQRTITSITFL